MTPPGGACPPASDFFRASRVALCQPKVVQSGSIQEVDDILLQLSPLGREGARSSPWTGRRMQETLPYAKGALDRLGYSQQRDPSWVHLQAESTGASVPAGKDPCIDQLLENLVGKTGGNVAPGGNGGARKESAVLTGQFQQRSDGVIGVFPYYRHNHSVGRIEPDCPANWRLPADHRGPRLGKAAQSSGGVGQQVGRGYHPSTGRLRAGVG